MAAESNEAIIHCLIDEAKSRGNIGFIDGLPSDELVDHIPLSRIDPNHERAKLEARKVFHGTPAGETAVIHADSNHAGFVVIGIQRLANHKFADYGSRINQLSLLHQPSIMPKSKEPHY